MSTGRRYALLAGGAAVIWYVCIVGFWAVRPMTDAVPVGVDYTLKTPAPVSVSVGCNNLFDGTARRVAALPPLKVQPAGKPKLAFPRDPCAIVHGQARTVFALDTVVLVAVLGCLAWLALRSRRSPSADPIGSRAYAGNSV